MADIKKRLKHSLPAWLWPTLATLLGVLVRVSFITKSSIWHDEGFSIMLAKRSMIEIWAGSARDVHPPLYYELLHVWMKVFGSSELAIRSLSMVAGVAIIPIGYLIVRKIAGLRAAILASFVLALAPFLIRYSQEARMYGLLGLFLLLALFAVVHISEKPKQTWPYILFIASITAGLYTHYFTVLAVIAFWIYFIILERPKTWQIGKSIWLSARWWLANIAVVILFIPWVPNLVGQLRRGQGLSWLPVATIRTFSDTIWQFFSFTDGRALFVLIYWIIPILIIIAGVYIWLRDKNKPKLARLLVLYSFLPIAIGLLISIKKPIFHERYFAFASIGIYLVIVIAIDWLAGKRTWLFAVLATLLIGIECIGIRNVYYQSNHQMKTVMQTVNQGYRSGDKLIAGEMYVYFDGSYYNSTPQTVHLYTAGMPPNGYGESGLLYNKNIYLNSYATVSNNSRVWLIGKTGDHSYYNQIPSSWKLLEENQAGYSEVRLYQVQ